MFVPVSTGCPFKRAGSYCHWLTASRAALANRGSTVFTTNGLRTAPAVEMTARMRTLPSIPSCWRSTGYSGLVWRSSRTAVTLPPTRIRCGVRETGAAADSLSLDLDCLVDLSQIQVAIHSQSRASHQNRFDRGGRKPGSLEPDPIAPGGYGLQLILPGGIRHGGLLIRSVQILRGYQAVRNPRSARIEHRPGDRSAGGLRSQRHGRQRQQHRTGCRQHPGRRAPVQSPAIAPAIEQGTDPHFEIGHVRHGDGIAPTALPGNERTRSMIWPA